MSSAFLQDCFTEEKTGKSQQAHRAIGTKVKRTLIIPDVHLKYKIAQSIIDSVPHDAVIHLGDHQDSFGDTIDQAVNTAKWTKDRLDAGDTILLGNHDLPYWFPHPKHEWGCGWDSGKHFAIQRYLSTKDRKKFKLWVECAGWLLSHAGFCSMYTDLIPYHDIFIDETLHAGTTHPLIYAVGASRGGVGRGGGCLWLDWQDMIQEPVLQPFRQIVGHTPYSKPQYHKGCAVAHNLDTHLGHYGIIEGGKLSVHEVEC